jgi:hypothetical protein
MLRIRDILVGTVRIRESVPLTNPDSDPGPGPVFFISDLQDAKQKTWGKNNF